MKKSLKNLRKSDLKFMTPRKQLLSNTNLYLIVSITDYKNHNILYARTASALKAGIKILQLRCKGIEDCLNLSLAQKFNKLSKENHALFIVNDRVDVAFCCNADGVHLGQDDLPIASARNILGKDKIIGRSTHSLKQALQAQSERADYIGFGPVFKTQTKPVLDAIGVDSIRPLVGKIKIPFFVLGGVDKDNISQVLDAGAKRVAVSNAILADRDTRAAVKNLKKLL